MPFNEFGASIDRNGYAPSLFNTTEGECFICGAPGKTERHEIFGAALRTKSKELGLWLNLCPYCHRLSKEAVHQSEKTANRAKNAGQRIAMATYDWSHEEWLRRFYKNYIMED